ncbi:MAG: hypothetical protein AVDCRST_MAG36-2650, partial [uncultured Nocardioidaceae bacterium]
RGRRLRHLGGPLRHRRAVAAGVARRLRPRAALRGGSGMGRAQDRQPLPAYRRPGARPARAEDRHGRDRGRVRRSGHRHRPHPRPRRGGVAPGDPCLAAGPVDAAAAHRGGRRQLHRRDRRPGPRRRGRGLRVRRQHRQEGRRAQPGTRGPARPRLADPARRQRRRHGDGRRHRPQRRVPRGGGGAVRRRPRPDGGRRALLRRGRRGAARAVPAQRVPPLRPRGPPPPWPALRAHRHRLAVPPAGAADRRRQPRPLDPGAPRRRLRHHCAHRGQRAHDRPEVARWAHGLPGAVHGRHRGHAVLADLVEPAAPLAARRTGEPRRLRRPAADVPLLGAAARDRVRRGGAVRVRAAHRGHPGGDRALGLVPVLAGHRRAVHCRAGRHRLAWWLGGTAAGPHPVPRARLRRVPQRGLRQGRPRHLAGPPGGLEARRPAGPPAPPGGGSM